MSEADLDRSIVPHVPIPTRGRSPWVRGMACIAILPLLGFIGQTGRTIWDEFRSLRKDHVSLRKSAIVGFLEINPQPSYASKPLDWFHDEGDDTVLWAAWRGGENHWYRFGRGEIDRQRISGPLGQDVIRAIDYPLFELAGGPHWTKVPDESLVAGFGSGKGCTAYPLRVLDKVQVVNDLSGDRPVVVAFTPVDETVSVYEAAFEGHRMTVGHSGYFFGKHPILYDRRTESLWSEQDQGIVAVAGRRKGTTLNRIAQAKTVTWGEWRADHPDGKLLIGADRSRSRLAD
jgi:Protein of unknown function (DUF3179)